MLNERQIKRRYFFRRRAKYPYIFILLFILISGYYVFQEKKTPPITPAEKSKGKVIKIHDGDTLSIIIDNTIYRARLIGIDAPEMGQKPWGERAKRALSNMLGKGESIFIETDIEMFDRYNRLLIYLFNEKGIFINEQLLLEGYAVLFTLPPNIKYVDRLVRAEKMAREMKKGIWGKRGLKEMPSEYKERHKQQS